MSFENVRLGKQEHKHDPRTLMLARFVSPDIRIPAAFDFDALRRPFPIRMMGNDMWGNCVVVGETNQLLRLERVEQRRTLAILDEHVIARYKSMTGAKRPGDENDNGLVILEAMRNWKNEGYGLGPRSYKIAAYGELEPSDRLQLRQAIFALHGIHLGFWLPRAAQSMGAAWDYKGQTGPEWKPGSWGGHLVFSKAYRQDTIEILTWGKKVNVTNAFIERYADEAWAVVDSMDSWRVKQTINVPALTDALSRISTRVNR